MTINTSTVAASYVTSTWFNSPGKWIQERAGSIKAANTAFKDFINHNAPQAKKLIINLINTRHLFPIHLPMPVYMIFLSYIGDQIELYQNQREERNPKVDLEWHKFLRHLAKERYQLFTQNTKWATCFFQDLKNLLKESDVLPTDFDATVDVWLQLICIEHINDIYLTSLFEKTASSLSLVPQNREVSINLPRNQLESSLYLIMQQFSNFKWVVENLKKNMKPINNSELEQMFDTITQTPWQQSSSIASNLHNDLKIFQTDFLSLDLTNNESIKIFSENIAKMTEKLSHNFPDCSLFINPLEKYIKDGENQGAKKPVTIANPKGHAITLPTELFSPFLSLLKKMQKCHLLTDCYLVNQLYASHRILGALLQSNILIENHKKGGPKPRLASQCPLLLPAPSECVYNEQISLELYNSPSKASLKKKKKIPAKPPVIQPPKKEKQKKPCQQTTPPAQPILDNAVAVKLNPLEQLRENIFKLNCVGAHVAIRQALWHIDALISLQHTPSVQIEEGLTLLNRVASSAHKLLEQTYRFCLHSQGKSLTTHNLKEYHLAFAGLPHPEIVQELYLANHWARYFYVEQERWQILSTQLVCTPPLIGELVDMAEGKLPSKTQLKKRMNEIVEKTRVQVDKMLSTLEAPTSDLSLTKDVPLQLKPLMPTDTFDAVAKTMKLSLFLIKTTFPLHHPAHLHLKQGISALSMLKVSVQRIHTAKSPCELATWGSQCLQQTHEVMEDVLHAIEFLKEGEVSIAHELKTLAVKVGLDMGALGDACRNLSFKVRYPAESLSDALGASIIDALETFRHCPQCLDNFELVGPTPQILWKAPTKNVSVDEVMAELSKFIAASEEFLRTKALPAFTKYT